jgi:hypothetical protein
MKNLSDLAESLRVKIRTLFPGGFVKVQHSDNLCSSLSVHFSTQPKEEWINGIFYNAKNHVLMFVSLANGQYEKDLNEGHLYSIDCGVNGFPFKLKNKNRATIQAIEKHVMKIFETLANN